MRRAALLIVAGAVAWRLAAFANEPFWGSWHLALVGAGITLGFYIVLAVGVVAIFALARKSRPPLEATATLVLIIGLLATIPVGFAYDDGCNDHTTDTPAGLVPILALAHPEQSHLSYQDMTTLVACS
jgi:hypothetical protein